MFRIKILHIASRIRKILSKRQDHTKKMTVRIRENTTENKEIERSVVIGANRTDLGKAIVTGIATDTKAQATGLNDFSGVVADTRTIIDPENENVIETGIEIKIIIIQKARRIVTVVIEVHFEANAIEILHEERTEGMTEIVTRGNATIEATSIAAAGEATETEVIVVKCVT